MVFYDDFFEGRNDCGYSVYFDVALWCKILATDITETTYLDTHPAYGGKIYYWVAACDEYTCRFLNPDKPAEFIP